MRILRFVFRQLVGLLKIVTYEWAVGAYQMLRRLIAALWALWKRRKLPHDQRHPDQECLQVRHPSFLRPDPTIYSQVYLMKLGLPVTWDNPDIRLFRNGQPVNESEPLLAATAYEVEATLWNNSYDSPALGMPVEFSFLTFGIATTSTPIGTTTADVGVKGSPSHPATTRIVWTTPQVPGHYCLQVNLRPFDDVNLENNLGQNNLNVALAQSPATFHFAVRNPLDTDHTVRLTVDTYEPLELPECEKIERRPGELRSARIDRIVAQHRQRDFSVPAGWDVQVNPKSVSLAPNAGVDVELVATPPAGFAGEQRFNVNAIADGIPIGGVSLIVQKA
jgi:hypothetical protein